MAETKAPPTVALINYGAGNVHSVQNALEVAGKEAGATVHLTAEPETVRAATHIVLPGVGAFGDCLAGLQNANIIPTLIEQVLEQKKPFLGICVGMQLLATVGKEHGEHLGLDWLPGEVVPLSPTEAVKIPHMGWNDITINHPHPIVENVENHTDFYFVHSYHMVMKNAEHVLATTTYGKQEITAVVGSGNIMGTQFHPEKSQQVGQLVLKNFLRMR